MNRTIDNITSSVIHRKNNSKATTKTPGGELKIQYMKVAVKHPGAVAFVANGVGGSICKNYPVQH